MTSWRRIGEGKPLEGGATEGISICRLSGIGYGLRHYAVAWRPTGRGGGEEAEGTEIEGEGVRGVDRGGSFVDTDLIG